LSSSSPSPAIQVVKKNRLRFFFQPDRDDVMGLV